MPPCFAFALYDIRRHTLLLGSNNILYYYITISTMKFTLSACLLGTAAAFAPSTGGMSCHENMCMYVRVLNLNPLLARFYSTRSFL